MITDYKKMQEGVSAYLSLTLFNIAKYWIDVYKNPPLLEDIRTIFRERTGINTLSTEAIRLLLLGETLTFPLSFYYSVINGLDYLPVENIYTKEVVSILDL